MMTGRWQKWIAIVLAVVWVIALAPAARAQEDIERARLNTMQWLLTTLGKPGLILVEYTYSGTSWPDTSLGCPTAGETVRPETVHGYNWTFFFDNMVRYEVHSNLDGTLAVLCSATNVAPDVRLTTYSTTAYTILVPEPWLVFASADKSEVLFAPQADDVCDQPGMRVTVLGRVASGVTPDQLIDEYLAGRGFSDTPTARTSAGSFGRFTEFESPCDTFTRQWRLSTVVQLGSAYQVEQWAPQDQFDQWSELFVNMVNQFSPAGTSTILPGEPDAEAVDDAGTDQAAAPAAPFELSGLPLAHVFVGDVFLGALNAIPGRSVTTVPDWERRFLTFSPDGLSLAFVDGTNAELRVIDTAAGRSARRVAEGIDPAFPPAWSPDGSRIATVAASSTGEDASLAIRAVALDDGEPQPLGTFTLAGECAAAPQDPADAAFFLEVGPGGHDPVLVWLPGDLILVSTRCDGGLGVLDPADNGLTELGADLIDGVAAPDRTRFAARTASGIAILDFETWQRTDLSVGEGVSHLAWSADGETVYYALERLADSRTLDAEADRQRGEAAFGFWPVTIRVADLTLAAVDLDTRQERVLWRGQGRGIGRIAPAPDGSGLLFSLVPSGTLVAEVFQSGGDAFALRENWPLTGLYWLGNGETTARLLAYSSQPAFAPVTVGGE